MKPALTVCMVVACTMCGHALAGAIERRKRMIGDILAALRMLQISLGSMLDPLKDALKQTRFPLFESVSEKLLSESCPAEAWAAVTKKECSRGGRADCLAARDLAALDRLFDHLGASGRLDQTEAIQSCILALEESLAEAKERSSQVSKLYTSLGFLAGLALAILMI